MLMAVPETEHFLQIKHHERFIVKIGNLTGSMHSLNSGGDGKAAKIRTPT